LDGLGEKRSDGIDYLLPIWRVKVLGTKSSGRIEKLRRASVTWVVLPLHFIHLVACARGYVIREVFLFQQFTYGNPSRNQHPGSIDEDMAWQLLQLRINIRVVSDLMVKGRRESQAKLVLVWLTDVNSTTLLISI